MLSSVSRKGSSLPTSSLLPSLKVSHKCHLKSKKHKITAEKVGQSDIDAVTNAHIRFTSIPLHLDSPPLKPSKNFDSQRPTDFPGLFISKLRECCIVVDLSAEKEGDRKLKASLIKELVGAFQFPTLVRKMTTECVDELVKMVLANIVRAYVPVKSFSTTVLFDRVEHFCDDAWSTVVPAYSLLEALVMSTHVKPVVLYTLMHPSVIRKLFGRFATPDQRERHAVRTILYAIARRIPERVSLMFTAMNNALIDAISGEPMKWGLPQILELFVSMASAISQFAALGFEQMCVQVFLPLHLQADLAVFYTQLFGCIDMVLSRSPGFVDPVIGFLLRYFPLSSQKKQMLFLREIEDLVAKYWSSVLPNSICALIPRIAALFSNACEEISEKALNIMLCDGFMMLIKQYYARTVPMIVRRARAAASKHWHEVPQNLAIYLIQELQKLEPNTFHTLVGSSGNIAADDARARHEMGWRIIREGVDQSGRVTTQTEAEPVNARPCPLKRLLPKKHETMAMARNCRSRNRFGTR